MLLALIIDAWRFLMQCLRPAPALAAENLFLRKQLALYEERQVHPRQATNATRLAMVWLSHWFDWRAALRIVEPETFTRWHREGFRLFWWWKSKPGRPSNFAGAHSGGEGRTRAGRVNGQARAERTAPPGAMLVGVPPSGGPSRLVRPSA